MCQVTNRARIDKDNWIRCVYCGHKLGRLVKHPNDNECIVELKCHSCKTVNLCYINRNEEIEE